MEGAVQFRFAGTKLKRAEQIAPTTWAKYELKIREMHPTKKLEDLMDAMEEEHGFKATHQFRKWGLRRYEPRAEAKINPEQGRHQQHDAGAIQCDTARILEDHKRQRKTQSTDIERAPSLPRVSKKQKFACSDGDTEGDTEDFISPETFTCCTWEPSTDSDVPNHMFASLANQFQSDLRIALNTAISFRAFRRCAISYLLRGENELNKLRSIADYLGAILCLKEACNIYAVLLQIEQAKSPEQPESLVTPLLIACARTAQTWEQCDLVQEVLLKRMQQSPKRAYSSSEYEIAHTLLARSFHLQDNSAGSQHHLFESWRAAYYNADRAVRQQTSLLFVDTLIHIHYSSPSTADVAGMIPVPILSPFPTQPGQNHDENLTGLGIFLAGTTGRLLRTYLPSCINWISVAIRSPHAALQISSIQELENGQQSFLNGLWSANILFSRLWRLRHRIETSHVRWLNIWDEIGIPSAEILHICCELVVEEGLITLNASTDAQLGTMYLQRLKERKCIFHDIQKHDMKPRNLSSAIQGIESDTSSPSNARNHSLALPKTDADTQDSSKRRNNPSATPEVEPETLCSCRLPTMASSLRSSDASYRRLKELRDTFASTGGRMSNWESSSNEAPSSGLRFSRSPFPSLISQLSDQMNRFSLHRSSQASNGL
ncbi:hypothetical protein JX266_012798 [Neoarthrinium moseri]|nr:hypothetical protein JX266_012798 [Neoarthrinium moseri]